MKHAAVAAAALSLGMHCERKPAPQVAQVAPIATAARPLCGDGIVTADEQCDDGNVTAGDGCHACKIEAPQCGPGTDGVVWRWQCAGSPSRCTLAACTSTGTGADCSADLATRTLTARVRLDGFVDASRADHSRVTGGGLDCTCQDTLGGLACGPGCTHEVPTCARTTPTATSATAQFARWSWACSGTGASCTVQPDADTTIDATFTAAPIALAGTAVLPNVSALRTLAVDDSGAILVAGQTSDGHVGRIAISENGVRVFAAVITRGGIVSAAVDLGAYDRDFVHAGVFAGDGFWLVAGHEDDPYRSSDDQMFRALRFDRSGVRSVAIELGHVESSPLAMAARQGGGVVLAVTSKRRDGREWRADKFMVIAYDRAGALAWRRVETSDHTSVWPSAMRAIGADLLLAGSYETTGEHAGTLITQPRSSRMQRFVLRFDDRGRATAPYLFDASDRDEIAGTAIDPEGGVIALLAVNEPDHLGVLERRDLAGRVVWRQAIGTKDRVTPWIDPRALAVSSAGDRIAFVVREQDETQDGNHGRVVIRVADGHGAYLHAWSIPAPAPATFGAGLGGFAHDQAILAGEVTGPLTIGHVRFAGGTRVSAALWLDPQAHPGLAR